MIRIYPTYIGSLGFISTKLIKIDDLNGQTFIEVCTWEEAYSLPLSADRFVRVTCCEYIPAKPYNIPTIPAGQYFTTLARATVDHLYVSGDSTDLNQAKVTIVSPTLDAAYEIYRALRTGSLEPTLRYI